MPAGSPSGFSVPKFPFSVLFLPLFVRKFPKSVLKLPFPVLFSFLLLYHSIPFYTNFWPHLYQLQAKLYQLLTASIPTSVKLLPTFDQHHPNFGQTYDATTHSTTFYRRKFHFHQFIIPWTHECMNPCYHFSLLKGYFLLNSSPFTCQLHVGHIQTSWSRHFVSDQVWWLRWFLHP